MRKVKQKLRKRYENFEPPQGRIIIKSAEKLFTTGSILDQSRPGRLNAHGDTEEVIENSVRENPTASVRAVSFRIGCPEIFSS